MLLGTLKGILVAVVVSLLALAQQAYNPAVYALGRKRGTNVFRPLSSEHPDDETWPGLLMVRIGGAAVLRQRAAHRPRRCGRSSSRRRPSVVVLDCRAVIDIEYTALKMLIEAEEKLRDAGIALWLAALNPEVLEVVQRSPLGETLGRERMFFNLETAVERFELTAVHRSSPQKGAGS